MDKVEYMIDHILSMLPIPRPLPTEPFASFEEEDKFVHAEMDYYRISGGYMLPIYVQEYLLDYYKRREEQGLHYDFREKFY